LILISIGIEPLRQKKVRRRMKLSRREYYALQRPGDGGECPRRRTPATNKKRSELLCRSLRCVTFAVPNVFAGRGHDEHRAWA
jgi:hypothetical protein